MIRIVFLWCCLTVGAWSAPLWAQAVAPATVGSPAPAVSRTLYTSADSARVVELLRSEVQGESEVLFYARQFLGVPYVARTLEQGDPERLVVNLRQLDCTTLVETVLALTMTKRQNRDSFADYCHQLMQLRYWNGQLDGYLSRLHYFSWWMEDHLSRGMLQEVYHPQYFTQVLRVNNSYMSTYPSRYPLLKGRPSRIARIRQLEQQHNGVSWRYIPASALGASRSDLGTVVRDGDLIALVTRKKGLDFSHLGFAVWGSDRRLHLLNASSLHHRVVEEPKTLKQYLDEHPSCLGISVLRLPESE